MNSIPPDNYDTVGGPPLPRKRRWLEFQRAIPRAWGLGLGAGMWVLFLLLWSTAVSRGWANPLLLPAPETVFRTLYEMFVHHGFLRDVGASVYRILVSFAAACVIAVPIGILMGSFATVEAFVNPCVSAWRYLPAPSFIPLLLMWLGTGELQKLALLFIGVVFFLATLVMDHTKAVRRELIETALTLGANRWQVLTTVVIPAVMPNVVVAMRQMLAISWTYLVIAEIVAATDGIGAVMMRANRFFHVDQIMAGIVVIGVLGLLFDFLFGVLHRWMFPYLSGRS